MKRVCDILLVLLAAPLWLPLFALTALAVLLVEGRPVFFMQTRAGLHGRPFRIVTLDELPELFLVLVGNMSLVGPRPLPMRYLSRYTPEQMRRHEVRPGITGWAQIHGRNALEWESRFAHDVWYVDNRSLWLDAKILFLTVGTVFAARGISEKGEATMSTFKGQARLPASESCGVRTSSR